MNLVSLVKGIAQRFPEKEAIVADGKSLSFRDFWLNICAIAELYRDWDLGPGERILILLPNSAELLSFHFAALKIGAISVPVKTDYRSWELKHIIRNCQPSVLISYDAWLGENSAALEQGLAPRIVSIDHLVYDLSRGDDHVLPVKSNAIASINYTYFGEGYPKGAALTHANHVYAATGYARHQGFTEAERFLIILPMAHVYALSGCVNSGLIRGGTLVIMNDYSAKAIFGTIEKQRITILTAIPALFEFLARSPLRKRYDLSSLRLAVTGGDFMPEALQREFEQALGVQIVQGYGLTESLPVICNPPGVRNKPGTLGIPGRKDIEIRILGADAHPLGPGLVGEIVVKGPTTMSGYYGMPEDSRRILHEGWLYTGDYGMLDEDGFLHFCGLKKNIFNVYGNKVDPLELRSVLLTHSAVAEAQLFLEKSEDQSRLIGAVQVCARVTAKERCSVSSDELMDFLKARIAAYKVPRKIIVSNGAAQNAGSS